jgi:hypothetical protein
MQNSQHACWTLPTLANFTHVQMTHSQLNVSRFRSDVKTWNKRCVLNFRRIIKIPPGVFFTVLLT